MANQQQPKSALGRLGISLLDAVVFAADLGPMTRMTEIEQQIDELQKEYAELNEKLEAHRKRPVPYKQ